MLKYGIYVFMIVGVLGKAMPELWGGEDNPPYLIHHVAGIAARTQNLLKYEEYIKTLPFDGISVNIPISWYGMDPSYAYTYDDVYNHWLAPLKNRFPNLRHNFLLMKIRNPPDLFGDGWDQVLANWKVAAEAARDAGFEGIMFDNEEDTEEDRLWLYPDSVDFPEKSFAEYQAKALERGSQLMNAILSVFPEARVIVFHGPYVSCERTPAWMTRDQARRSDYDLRGAFFTGMLAVAPPQQ
ncbi:MAG: hypothetical protein D6820_06800, partial [Lentisphaerae bacterium]